MLTDNQSAQLWDVNKKMEKYIEEMQQQPEGSQRRGEINAILKELAETQIRLIEQIEMPSPLGYKRTQQ